MIVTTKWKDSVLLLIADEPFSTVVISRQISDRSFQTEWWVTGMGWKTERPTMLALLHLTVSSSLEDLETTLQGLWFERVEELAYSSALAGGFTQGAEALKALDDDIRIRVLRHLMLGHDHLNHFNLETNSVVYRTGLMFEFLKTLGVTQAQRVIADFETFNFAHNWEAMSRGEEVELVVKPSIVNQRLVLAKKAGIISSQHHVPTVPQSEKHLRWKTEKSNQNSIAKERMQLLRKGEEERENEGRD